MTSSSPSSAALPTNTHQFPPLSNTLAPKANPSTRKHRPVSTSKRRPPHPANWACTGNAFNVTEQCCSILGGTTNTTQFYCDDSCCDLFHTVGECPSNLTVPWCTLPQPMNGSAFYSCVEYVGKDISGATLAWSCEPPTSAGKRRAVPVVTVLLVLAAAVAAVVAV